MNGSTVVARPKYRLHITFHARQRMRERLGVHPSKIERVAKKAWNCHHWDSWRYKRLEYQRQFRRDGEHYRYRQMLGKIWVFEIEGEWIKLLTIY